MPNDTTTLNGALRQLGETMAANLTTQGVPSTYDEGLTTLAGKILDIQGGGGTRTLTLTADKSILSYYDGDEAILSATLLEDGVAVSGATVEFFNGSTSMGTAQTDSNGVATKTYTSTGAGDVSLKAEADNGTLVSERYIISDCIKAGFNGWNGTFSTGTDTYDYLCPTGTGVSPSINLPSNWKMSYKFKNMRTDNDSRGTGLYVIGTNTNNGVLIGHEGSDRRIRIYSRTNGSNTVRATENYVYSYQTWTDAEITYENGTITMTVGGKSVSYNLSSSVIIQFYNSYPELRIAEWKIKPL